MKKLKIFPKTFLYTASLMLTITCIAHALLYCLMPMVYMQQKQQELISNSDQLIDRLKQASESEAVDMVKSESQRLNLNISLDYGDNHYNIATFSSYFLNNQSSAETTTQFDKNDISSSESITNPLENQNAIGSNKQSTHSDYIKNNSSYMVLGKNFHYNGGQSGYIQLQETLQPINEAKRVILSILPATLLICFLVSIVFSYFYSRRITKPIKEISSTTEQMKKLNELSVCKVSSDDEIGALAKNINGLYRNLLMTIEKLQFEISHVSEVEKSKVDFMRAASHELKTPVTALSAMLENMMLGVGKYKNHDDYLPKCKLMTDRLCSMIQEILDTSKLNDLDSSEMPQIIAIANVAEETAEPFIPIAKARGITLKIDLSGQIEKKLPIKLFKKALANILSNAVNYADSGKNVNIVLKTDCLIVDNECAPIPADQIGRLFEPFYRQDYSRSRNTGGNGLGLYITDKILSKCDLQYSFEPIKNGMRFIIHL